MRAGLVGDRDGGAFAGFCDLHAGGVALRPGLCSRNAGGYIGLFFRIPHIPGVVHNLGPGSGSGLGSLCSSLRGRHVLADLLHGLLPGGGLRVGSRVAFLRAVVNGLRFAPYCGAEFPGLGAINPDVQYAGFRQYLPGNHGLAVHRDHFLQRAVVCLEHSHGGVACPRLAEFKLHRVFLHGACHDGFRLREVNTPVVYVCFHSRSLWDVVHCYFVIDKVDASVGYFQCYVSSGTDIYLILTCGVG